MVEVILSDLEYGVLEEARRRLESKLDFYLNDAEVVDVLANLLIQDEDLLRKVAGEFGIE